MQNGGIRCTDDELASFGVAITIAIKLIIDEIKMESNIRVTNKKLLNGIGYSFYESKTRDHRR